MVSNRNWQELECCTYTTHITNIKFINRIWEVLVELYNSSFLRLNKVSLFKEKSLGFGTFCRTVLEFRPDGSIFIERKKQFTLGF